jgi:hypothetical protein
MKRLANDFARRIVVRDALLRRFGPDEPLVHEADAVLSRMATIWLSNSDIAVCPCDGGEA